MKIKVWTAIINNGDGSNSIRLYPTEADLRETLQLDEDDFEPYGDIPVEIDSRIINVNDYLMVE